MKFAVIANPQKYEVKEVFKVAVKWAIKNQSTLLIPKELGSLLDASEGNSLVYTQDDIEAIVQCDVILVMGGDGTMLNAAGKARTYNKPVLGVNSGRLGFMTNTQNEELTFALDEILAGNYTLDERHYLKAVLPSGEEFYALNEIFFTRSEKATMVNITAEYADTFINSYWADGLIVASSTGSTAYNLSTGGPIVEPGSGVLLITPVNPHSLTTRPLVVSARKPLYITIGIENQGVLFSYDGNLMEIDKLPLKVEIRKSEQSFNLIQLKGHDFFDTLRKKLMWGQDSRRQKP